MLPDELDRPLAAHPSTGVPLAKLHRLNLPQRNAERLPAQISLEAKDVAFDPVVTKAAREQTVLPVSSAPFPIDLGPEIVPTLILHTLSIEDLTAALSTVRSLGRESFLRCG